ncbi:MAG: hypothetical protein ACLFN8_03140 [Candidatus Woesearchaeota archaeon]
MKKNKKATIWESLQGIIIFALILVAVILFFRDLTSENAVNTTKTIQELQEVLAELTQAEGSIRHQIELDSNSAMIVYAKDKESIMLNFEITSQELQQFHSNTLGKFPQNNNQDITKFLNENKIKGIIKQKPISCTTNNACICYCEEVDVETISESQYNSRNAYLTCKKETCTTIQQEISDKIYLQQFFEEVDRKYRPLTNSKGEISITQAQPDQNSTYWDGGFIIMRTAQDLGSECMVIRHSTGFGMVRTNPIYLCETIYQEGIKENQKSLVIRNTLAGYTRSFVLRYIDVEFRQENGKIHARLI